MKVRYTIDALLHIAAIQSYISERNPAAAITRGRTHSNAPPSSWASLRAWDMTGTAAGTREWVVDGTALCHRS